MRPHLLAVSCLALFACEKSKPAAVAAPPAPAPAAEAPKKEKPNTAGKAEVEFFGKWSAGELKPAKVLFVAQAEPCTPVPEKPTRYGEHTLTEPGPLFAEFFIPQGTVGHACVYGLDAEGKVIGAAGEKQNPMTFQGEGEVIFGKLEYTLAAP